MQINTNFINSVLDYYSVNRLKSIELFKRAQCREDGVPILTREYLIGDVVQTSKINNKLNNDFFNEIVNTKTGYFAGVPITMSVPRESYPDVLYGAFMDAIRDFNNINDIDYLNSETTRFSAISGYSGRLLYIDEQGEIKLFNVPGYQCFFMGNNYQEPDYALRIYPVLTLGEDSRIAYTMKCDVYDSMNVYKFTSEPFYTTNAGLINLTAVDWKAEQDGIKPHLFDGIPLIRFQNNPDEKGDAENVLQLIDTYDRVLSDLDNELEQARLAYMKFRGCRPDKDMIDAAMRTGAFGFDDATADVDFLVKNLNGQIIFDTLKRLQDNILHFSATPNMRDEAFSGTLSGVALDYKIRSFENKCITSERLFERALRYQWRLILGIWALKNMPVVDWYDIDFIFTRNYPKNTYEEAQTTALLKGMVTEQTRLSLLSFVKDPYTEMQGMEEESANTIDLSAERARIAGESMTGGNDNGVQTKETQKEVTA